MLSNSMDQVLYGARHGPHLRRGRRVAVPHAAAAHETWCRTQAGDGVPACRAADGCEGFLADGNGGEIRRKRRARAAGRPADRPFEVVRIARDAEHRSIGIARRVLAQRCLAEDDSAGFAQPFDRKRVPGRPVILEYLRPQRRRHSGRVDLVLHQDGNAVQRPNRTRSLIGRIEPIGVLQCMVIERDDRIDGRTLLVVSSDAIEIGLDQPARRESGFERSMDILDRRLHGLKRIVAPLGMAGRSARCRQCEQHPRDDETGTVHLSTLHVRTTGHTI